MTEKNKIRQEAEKQIASQITDGEFIAQSHDIEALIHELRVHEIELELQNEALREAQQAQAEAEKHYFDLFQLAPVGYLIITSTGIIRDVNLTASDMLKTERQNLTDKPLSMFFDVDERARFFRFLQSVFATQMDNEIDLKMRHGLTSEYCNVQTKIYQKDAQWLCRLTMSDVTEKTHLALQAEQFRLRYQSVFDYSQNAIIIYNHNLRAIELNRSAQLTFNLAEQTHINDLMGPHWYTSQRPTIEEYGRVTGEIIKKETTTHNKRFFNFQFVHNLLPGLHMLILDDVTVQRMHIDTLQLELDAKNESLQDVIQHELEISKIRERIITTISHEFKTPLAIIQSAKDLLQRYFMTLDDNARHRRFTSIQHALDRLIQIVDDVIEIERHNQVQKPKYEMISLPDYVYSLVEDNWMDTEKLSRIQLDIQITQPIYIDGHLLDNIIVNLLSNALQYSDTNVECQIVESQSSAHIYVRDYGNGIAQKDIMRVFEPFYRSESVENFPGTGLGLYIVKRSVEQLNGTIVIESPGTDSGTLVHVTLPLIKSNL